MQFQHVCQHEIKLTGADGGAGAAALATTVAAAAEATPGAPAGGGDRRRGPITDVGPVTVVEGRTANRCQTKKNAKKSPNRRAKIKCDSQWLNIVEARQ